MRKTPQCDRFLEVREQSQVIGKFLDWVADQHGARLRVDDHPFLARSTEQLLAEFFGIDLDAFDREKFLVVENFRKTKLRSN